MRRKPAHSSLTLERRLRGPISLERIPGAHAHRDGGVDTFVKQDAGLFVFFQGHPEYESETLLGEYRRDVGRYLKGEMETYPLLPLDYFEEETERSLREIEAMARASRQEKLIGEVSAVLNGVRIQNTWHSTAVLIYRNWLQHLCTQKRHAGKLMLAVGV